MTSRVLLGKNGGTVRLPVTVANVSGNKYHIDGATTPDLNLTTGVVYIFDQSDSSNSGHPFRFSQTVNGTHGGGSNFGYNVTVSGTPGSAGAYTQISIQSSGTPNTLYYYCTNHSGMGNSAKITKVSGTFTGLRVSKPGFNVETAPDRNLLFDSAKNRTGQIYAGGAGLNFVNSSSDQEAAVRGTSNLFATPFSGQPNGGYTGKKIIIDGTTVTLSTTSSYFNYTYTTVANMVTDINAANISGVTASQSTLSSSNFRLRLKKSGSDMVVTYPTSNSLETIVGIAASTYDYPELSSTGINFLTGSGTTKPSLGYIPLLVLSEQVGGGYESEMDDGGGGVYESINRLSIWKTTTSNMHPMGGAAAVPANASQNGTFVGDPLFMGRSYDYHEDDDIQTDMTNASFFVLRIPCAYGYMTSTYFG